MNRAIAVASTVLACLWAVEVSANSPMKFLVKNSNQSQSTIVFSFATESLASQCSGSVSGVVSTRASAGYCVKSDGTMVVLTNNTTRSGVDGIMEEAQGQNVILRSEEIDNAAWGKTNSSISATNVSEPAGGTTADTLLSTAGAGRHNITQGYTATAAPWTCSSHVKSGTAPMAWLSIDNGTSYVHFNLTNGTVGTAGVGNTGRITALSNSWYRIEVTRTMGAGATNTQLGVATTDAAASFTSAGTESVHVWGFQCELGTRASSYYQTLGTTGTRLVERSHIIPSNTGTLTSSGACIGGTLKNSRLAESTSSVLMNPFAILASSGNYFAPQFGTGSGPQFQCFVSVGGVSFSVTAPGVAGGTSDTFKCILDSTNIQACLNGSCGSATAHGKDITQITTPSIDFGWLRQLSADRQPNGGLSSAYFARSSGGCP